MKSNEFITGSIIRDPHGIEWTVSETHKGIVTCVRDGDVNRFYITSPWAEMCELVLNPKSTVENIITYFVSLGFTQDCVVDDIVFIHRLNIYVRINKDSIVRIYDDNTKVYEGQILSFMFLKLLIENLGL